LKSSGVSYRLGRVPDPWAVPDWALAGADGQFGNRFDDPDATYRVLYASSQRLGCFLETLARFRIDPKWRQSWRQSREKTITSLLGKCLWNSSTSEYWELPGGEYADICSSEWTSRLRKSLATHLSRFGVEDIDASVLQKTAPRTLTQCVSRIVSYAGFSRIYYLSKYGHDTRELGFVRALSNQRERSRNGFSRRSRLTSCTSTSLLEVQRIAPSPYGQLKAVVPGLY
jgi:hypothetical protein